jgi:MFS family permease
MEYPRHFWTVVVAMFIDRLGGALIFPFFTLYITKKFGVGMTTVGVVFGIFSVTSIVGTTIGGALSDRFGRKVMLLLGLVVSAISMLWLGFVDDLDLFFAGTVVVGLLANIGGPAQQAMIADLLPESQRAQGFGIMRVTANLAITIGPLLGGLLASISYRILFVSDAVTSLITAAIVMIILPETRPRWGTGSREESVRTTFAGYGRALRDTVLMIFIFGSILMSTMYIQMNSTLAVFLRDIHGIDERGFGYILSLNAGMVVLFQFPITRRISRYRPLLLMASGCLLYALGFSMYGWVARFSAFLFAMVIITIGEMLVAPVAQAFVAEIAPADMRGRYMAMYGFSWTIPTAIGPILAGLIMDNLNPRLVWYAAGLLGLLAALTFSMLHRRISRSVDRTHLHPSPS